MSPNNRKDSGKSPVTDAERKKVEKLLNRAQNGDKKVLPALREAMNRAPEMYRILGDLSKQVENSVVKNISGDDLVTKEAIPRHLSDMKRELAGDDPSPTESLLAERIAACWLQLQYYEAIYAQNLRELSIRQSEFQQKRIDQAHRRYLSAIRTLAQVRKLVKPSVAQINIAEKQINTVGGP